MRPVEEERVNTGSSAQCECPAGDVTIYAAVAIEKVEKSYARDPSFTYSEVTIKALEQQCWQKIKRVAKESEPVGRNDEPVSPKSFQAKRIQQQRAFKSLLGNVELSLREQSGTASQTKATHPATDTLMDLFDMGRYLQLSAGHHALSNLQGVWADGAKSSWSGDYHMNINLQMNHWASPAIGLGSVTSEPLKDFIRKLRLSGTKTADSFYHCKGWWRTDLLMNIWTPAQLPTTIGRYALHVVPGRPSPYGTTLPIFR